jgi:diguanylate cyclase (GGDEF)-like protein/PAS domain S-box-containing protein
MCEASAHIGGRRHTFFGPACWAQRVHLHATYRAEGWCDPALNKEIARGGACLVEAPRITSRTRPEDQIQLNRALQALSSSTLAFGQIGAEQGLAQAACRIAVECGYRRAAFQSATTDLEKQVLASAGADSDLQIQLSLPVRVGVESFGVLHLYADDAEAFDADEMAVLNELAGELSSAIATVRARSEQARLEQLENDLHDAQLRAVAFEAQEGIVITDARNAVLKVNGAFTAITGYASEDAVGKTLRLLQAGYENAADGNRVLETLAREGSWQGEVCNRRKTGERYPAWTNITAVKDSGGSVTHYVITMTDITARKAAEQRIEQLAYYDALTQLPNRRRLLDRLQQALRNSGHTRRKGALLFIDLDNFKILNDTIGHDVGDRLLCKVAQRLTASVRDGDTLARLGGDEFVVMLEELSESAEEAAGQAKRVGEQILLALNRPYMLDGRVHYSTPSIGVALFSEADTSVEELLKQADIAMYQAKSAGRNALRFFDPDMQASLVARARLEAALRRAIQERQFTLHYQPQVDLARGIVGAEALLRWVHPEHGLVLPGQFISLAEETGLILAIGQWVLESACAQLRSWAADPRTSDLHMAVNISALQFRQADFVDQVRRALQKAGARPQSLVLDLTESLVLADIEDTVGKMQSLGQLGVGFALDDFGTGLTSLSNLPRLPLKQLKIDRSLIRRLPDSPNDALVVRTIITMARALGVAVIAEGVESEAQSGFLQSAGCSTWQGYLFSPPVEATAFDRLCSS